MVDSPGHARSKLGAAFVGGPPDPEVEELLRCNLATSNLDAAIRRFTEGGRRLSAAQLCHLIGLLMNQSGIDGETSTRVEAYASEALRECRAKQAR